MDHRTGLPSSTRSRRGNALVAALVVMAMIAVAVVVSTDEAISVHGETFHRSQQNEALAAAEAVLARRQGWLLKLANEDRLRVWTGGVDPTSESAPRDTTPEHEPNYGVDFIGRCAVLWKVEPARSVAPSDTPPTSDSFRYVVNPSPDLDYVPTDPKQITNEYTYLYQLSVESRLQLAEADEPLAKAEGSRYIAITGEPLFRYAIFYGKDGLKGDLELSHGPGVTIGGGVYSNGAIYIGSGTSVNEWTALTPASGATKIGPATNLKPVRCIGMDGIFRLSKPIIYSMFNNFPVNGAPGFSPNPSNYSLASGFPPNTDPPSVDFTSALTVADATMDYTWINPYRILDDNFATRGVGSRTINGVPILGVGTPNDSRDVSRSGRPSSPWNPLSLTNFNRRALTRVTNAPKKVLPDTMKYRPLEMQQLEYPLPAVPMTAASDNPADDIDEHLKAQPLFLDAAFNPARYAQSVDVDGAGPLGEAEVPGTYARYALGDPESVFVRKSQPFTGWVVRRVTGTGIAGSPPAASAGLIIRERAVPDFSYYDSFPPDLNPVRDANAYFPFAYGKHKRPLLWPFTAMFISDRGINASDNADTRTRAVYMGLPMVALKDSANDRSPAQTNESYSAGGFIELNTQNHSRAWPSEDTPDDDGGWYRSNWRFVHLRKAPAVSAADPRIVDLSAPASYFSKSNFTWIQARIPVDQIQGGSLETDNHGRKLGLMIHPVDLANALPDELPASGTDLDELGLNARKPFAAMLFSPERGFFTQRRMERSWVAYAGAAFTNTGADGFQEPGTETVYLVNTDIETEQTSGVDTSRTGEPPTTFNLINYGEGYFSLRGGSYKRTVSRQSTAKGKSRLYYTFELSGLPAGAGFIPFDAGNSTIDLFHTTYGGPWASGAITDVYSPSRIRARMGEWNNGNASASVSQDELSRYSSSGTFNKVIYRTFRDGDGNIQLAGQWQAASTFLGGDAQLKLALEGMGYTVDLSDPPPDPMPAPPAAVLPPVPPTVPPIVVGPSPTDPAARLFRVIRGGRVELNSIISQRGAWHDASALNTVPWMPSTVANDVQQFLPRFTGVLQSNYPLTSSYRPDLWSGRDVGGSIDYKPPTFTEAAGPLPPSVVANPWLDAQILPWKAGPDYTPGTAVLAGGHMWKCLVGSGSGTAAQAPGLDATWRMADQAWVRIEKSGNVLSFKYYVGTDPDYEPVDTDFTEVTDGKPGGYARVDVSKWPDTWMIGVAGQSGSVRDGSNWIWHPLHALFGNVSLKFSGTAPDDKRAPNDILDYRDWEDRNPGEPTDMTRYLCSQYQAFWGTQEITEDFFRAGENDGPRARPATEDWFYNLREFWSQSRWWNEGDYLPDGTPVPSTSWIERETGTNSPPAGPSGQWDSTWRQLWARTTVLNINLRSLQQYLRTIKVPSGSPGGLPTYRTRTLNDATSDRIGGPSPVMTPAASTAPLIDSFSGLILAARTNRYPWNPQPWRSTGGATIRSDFNPFNPELPNLANIGSRPDYNAFIPLKPTSPRASSLIFTFDPANNPPVGGTLLGPEYGAFPIKSVDFHHGVMISSADDVTWKKAANDATMTWTDNKLTIVTPNQLFIQGDLNTKSYGKTTPLAVMGDSITLLSNAWRAASYQMPGLTVSQSGIGYVNGYPTGGSLVASAGPQWTWGDGWHRASDTTYRACFVTNNQPTTRDRVRMGEGAPFVNTMLFMENWGSDRQMTYSGSLVVLDTCRYTHGFLLEANKTFGRSPFGIMGWWKATPDWGPAWGPCPGSPPAYTPPSRRMDFNLDLLTREGMPPFSPFAITTVDVGSWTRVTQ